MGAVPVQRGVTGMGSIPGAGGHVPPAQTPPAAAADLGVARCQRPLAIAFVACTRNRQLFRHDPSFIYRCENLGLALQAAGHGVTWLHLSSLPLAGRFDVAVFHRPQSSAFFRMALGWLRWRGTLTLADVDDLVFEPEHAAVSPAALNGQLPVEEIRRRFAAHQRALAAFDRLTTSTEPLAAHLRQRFAAARVAVLPNAVHRSWRGLRRGAAAPQPQRPVISYHPGTRSHDRDFALYVPALAEFLARHEDARLEVTGPLQLRLTARPGQIVHRDKLPFGQYHERAQGHWLNLAPLEATPFTRCKSALKTLEAGFWGTPTVGSPIPDASRFAGAGALFAPDAQACHDALLAMLDPGRYRAATQGLPDRVLALADVDAVAQAFVGLVEGVRA